MKKSFFILPILIVSFLACQSKPKTEITKKHIPVQEIKPKLMDITSYTGNALIFFAEEYHVDPHAYLFLIDEKDTKVFVSKLFDIRKAIRGKCSIYTNIGYYRMNKLQACKEKQIVDFEICNVDTVYKYYAKVWVSYENMVETRNKRTTPLLTDSCEARNLHSYHFGKKKGKDLEFKILKLE